ncbi:WXG100 family type VII secretion target [Nocardia paucivorans]|uniref:WXG100 family type VII secretion target n=1 Tax=Nocardia paucivorans TaxID=114259 RepID=UPI0002FD74ED|nr:WXG100 family type VII secretion target [Nocardia paucivorans]
MTEKQTYTAKEASEVINEFMEAIEGIRSTVGKVQESFDAARAGWQGDAAIAGQKASQAWQDEATEINQKIDAVKEVVFEGNKTYEQIDPTNVETLTNLI